MGLLLKSYHTTISSCLGGRVISIDIGVGKMLKFYLVFYVMGKGLLGELSCMQTGLVQVIPLALL